ncbi:MULTISPECIES: polyprenyl synthetase family protein [unclassified Lysinibacillus]|uniref:polyprenyl synthetase family protein n=1 Tax=unclassified Lysinibacillus TaxID=2636778 RepID=UPI0030FC5C57
MMEGIKQSLKIIAGNYQLSDEFNRCLNDLLDQHEGGDFSGLSKLHFQMNGGTLTKSIEEVFNLLELWILFTDIVDDIEDGDESKWGIDGNILLNASTALVSIVLLELEKLEIPYKSEVTRLFCHYLLQAVDGQHHDLMNKITSEEMYIDVVKKKSGSLIALSSTLGAVLATGKYTTKLEMSAHYIAIVAQLKNDYNDLLNLQRDLQVKKRTLPLLYLLQFEDSAFDELRLYYRQQGNATTKICITKQQIVDSGLHVYVHLIQSKYLNLALDLLKEVYPTQNVEIFKQYI